MSTLRTFLSGRPVVPIAEGISGRIQPGDGDKILWIHGYTLDSSSWGELWRLLPGWHHIGIDLPGHGASDPIDKTMDLRSLGIRLGNLCKQQQIRHIVALSFGTVTAIQIAIEMHDILSSIVLAAPAFAGGPQDMEVAQVYSELFRLYLQGGRGDVLGPRWIDCLAWRGLDTLPGLREALSSLVGRHSWAEMESFAIRQFTVPAQEENDLRGIQTPALILLGELEMAAYRQCAEILERTLPHSKKIELEDINHLCLLQSPDLSAKYIEEHLRTYAVTLPSRGN